MSKEDEDEPYELYHTKENKGTKMMFLTKRELKLIIPYQRK